MRVVSPAHRFSRTVVFFGQSRKNSVSNYNVKVSRTQNILIKDYFGKYGVLTMFLTYKSRSYRNQVGLMGKLILKINWIRLS